MSRFGQWLVLTIVLQLAVWAIYIPIEGTQNFYCWQYGPSVQCSYIEHVLATAAHMNFFLLIPTIVTGIVAYLILKYIRER